MVMLQLSHPDEQLYPHGLKSISKGASQLPAEAYLSPSDGTLGRFRELVHA